MGNSDSRTLFRDQVQQLVNSHLTAEGFDTWSGLFVFPESADDVLAMFPASDVRMLITEHPWNIKLVIDKVRVPQALEILEGLKDAESSYALEDFKHAANAARVLSRIIPVTLEPQFFEFYRYWWGAERRGIRVLNTALSLVLESTKSQSLGGDQALEIEGKIDALRMVLATVSEALYRQRGERDVRAELWHWVLASSGLSMSDPFLIELLQCAFAYSPPSAGWLPYASRLRSERSEFLSMLSLHTLLSLLFYEVPEKRIIDSFLATSDETTQACRDMLEGRELSPANTVIISVSTISDEATLALIADGVRRVLLNFRDSKNTYLPGALRPAITHVEVLYFLYFILVENDHFLRYFAKQAVEVVLPLFCLLEEKKVEEESGGIVCAGAIVLLKLTTSREFCLALNAPCAENMPASWPLFTGSLYDAFTIGNYESTANVLEFCNSQIQYKWDSAAVLIFALLTKADVVAKVKKLKAPEGTEAAEGVGWRATERWLERVREKLPTDTVVVMCEKLIPQLESLCRQKESKDESDALAFIRETTLVGLLPVPHPIKAVDYEHTAVVSSAVFWSFWVTVWEKHKVLFDEKGVQMFAAQDTE